MVLEELLRDLMGRTVRGEALVALVRPGAAETVSLTQGEWSNFWEADVQVGKLQAAVDEQIEQQLINLKELRDANRPCLDHGNTDGNGILSRLGGV
jgi:hypothetical protein